MSTIGGSTVFHVSTQGSTVVVTAVLLVMCSRGVSEVQSVLHSLLLSRCKRAEVMELFYCLATFFLAGCVELKILPMRWGASIPYSSVIIVGASMICFLWGSLSKSLFYCICHFHFYFVAHIHFEKCTRMHTHTHTHKCTTLSGSTTTYSMP